jgi:hypothetical protein
VGIVTVFATTMLTFGMCVIGAPMMLNLLSPLAGAVVVRTLPETAWDGAMLAFAQVTAAVGAFAIGMFVLGLPWYAALIAGFVVGITSYAVRSS